MRAPGRALEIVTHTSRPRLHRTVAASTAILLAISSAACGEPGRSTAAAVPVTVPAAAPKFVRFLLAPTRPGREDADLVAHKREAAATLRLPAAPASAPAPPLVRKKTPVDHVERASTIRTARQRQPQRASRTARPARAPAWVSTNRAVAFALAQVGKPYRWASAGPGSYDCSGLVMASYRQVGVNLPHQTGGIIHYGQPVSRGQLQPGDIVFPAAGHVGIYIGGGLMVHAPKPGDHVRVAPVYAFYAARRP